MSYAPGAPELIWAIPDDVLDDGAKLTLMRLWSKADHAVQQAPAPCDVWSAARPDHTPTQALHADLAEARGCSVRKIRRHLTKLRALGLAEANGRLVRLTPPANGHAVTTDGQSCPSTGDRQRADRDRERAPADRERASADRKGSAHLTPPVPPTPPSPAEEARDPDLDQPPKPRPGRQLVTGKPSSSTSDWRKNRARAQLEAQREREAAVITGEMPSGSKLPIAVHKAIEAHDSGAWSVSVASLTWADACADTMDADNLDLAHVLRLLDAWTAEARPTRQPGQPSKREIWFTWGDRGKRARAWVERTMEYTRAALRVVSDVDTYELELAEMRR